jgi:hypothetical protein
MLNHVIAAAPMMSAKAKPVSSKMADDRRIEILM